MVNFLHYPATLSEDDVIRYRRQSTRLLTEVNCPFCTEPWYFCQPRPKPLVNSHQKGLLPADFVSVNSKTNEAGDNKSNIYTLNYSREWQTESKLPDWYLGFLFFVKRPLYMNISPLFFFLRPDTENLPSYVSFTSLACVSRMLYLPEELFQAGEHFFFLFEITVAKINLKPACKILFILPSSNLYICIFTVEGRTD